jgi:ATP-dependent Lon protease
MRSKISLVGQVLSVGGIKKKVVAARKRIFFVYTVFEVITNVIAAIC